jgi:SAM-dependent methyltransferase
MSVARPTAAAFDGIAAQYDDIFTRSLIGRAQRDAVWEVVRRHFGAGESILELNCGTGEDAFFLADQGMKVLACDVSAGMIAVANQRRPGESSRGNVDFRVLAIEDLDELPCSAGFDGVFSNFSGLNCVADLRAAADNIGRLTRPGRKAILCFTNRYCLWEMLWYLLHGSGRKAFRRWASHRINARVGNDTVTISYPRLRQILRAFSPWFQAVEIRGIGIAVPPSYLEPWARRSKPAVRFAAKLDAVISQLPLVRGCGDHIVVVLERVGP